MSDDSLSDVVKDAQQNSLIENAKQSYRGLKANSPIMTGGAVAIDLAFVAGGIVLALQGGQSYLLAGALVAGTGLLGLAVKAYERV